MKKSERAEPTWHFTTAHAKGLFRYTFRAGRIEIHCGFSTKKFPLRVHGTPEFAEFLGRIESDDHREGEGGLRRFFLKPGERFAYGIQTHSANIAAIDRHTAKEKPGRFLKFDETDGLVTEEGDVRLGVFSADCLTILIGALDGPMPIAAVHAGWRGTQKGIAAEAVRRIAAAGADTRRCFALLGPSLRACCYEVGPEFKTTFPDTTTERNGKLYFDLVEENRRRLVAAGMRPADIVDSGFCTSCNGDLFYSWRREGEQALRMVSWIVKTVKFSEQDL